MNYVNKKWRTVRGLNPAELCLILPVSALCRCRRELSNAYLLAKLRFDTAESEPSNVCRDCEKERGERGVRRARAPARAREKPKLGVSPRVSAELLQAISVHIETRSERKVSHTHMTPPRNATAAAEPTLVERFDVYLTLLFQ